MSKPTSTPAHPPHQLSVLGGFLSYLVPGLGQIYQGRVAKGLLFLVCIYGLFFYGMWLGSGTVKNVEVNGRLYEEFPVTGNVYLPDATGLPDAPIRLGPIDTNPQGVVKALVTRPQFLGQFWVGAAAWPAILQYRAYDENRHKEGHPFLGHFERAPPDKVASELQKRADDNTHKGDKHFELGWVYTVIAGVLNILVIYDAFAGPAHPAAPAGKTRDGDKHDDVAPRPAP